MVFIYLTLPHNKDTHDVYYIAKYLFLFYTHNMEINLTPLEREVMLLLASGMNARAITDYLDISYKEYCKTKKNILKKMNINNRNQILITALTNQLIKL